MSYPQYVNGEPPVIGLREYDVAAWASSTCVDKQGSTYVVVDMQEPSKIVAKIDAKDSIILDQIYGNAHKEFSKQLEEKNVQRK